MAVLKREAVRVIWVLLLGSMKWVMGNGLNPASHGLRVCQWKGLTEIVADAENPHVVVAALALRECCTSTWKARAKSSALSDQ